MRRGPEPNKYPVLRAEGLAVARGGRTVLRDVTFSLHPGEAIQVTGPNGAGKSTLLRAVAGLLPLSGGRLGWIEAESAEEEDRPVAERVHYLGHVDGVKTALTAREALGIWATLAGEPSGSPEAALGRLGLAHAIDLPVGYLSAGQRRRVALARLVTAWRPLWLLDEPATALDRASQSVLAEIMAEHLAGGGMIVASTHAPLGLAGARELRLQP